MIRGYQFCFGGAKVIFSPLKRLEVNFEISDKILFSVPSDLLKRGKYFRHGIMGTDDIGKVVNEDEKRLTSQD